MFLGSQIYITVFYRQNFAGGIYYPFGAISTRRSKIDKGRRIGSDGLLYYTLFSIPIYSMDFTQRTEKPG